MANVNIKFNNKDYLLSCDDGQEENLKKLADYLDTKYSKLKKDLGNIGEDKLLLITSIKPLNKFDFKLNDLLSRIKNCLYVKLDVPDDELIYALIIKNFSDRQIIIEKKFINFIIKNIDRSYEKIYEFIYKIDEISLKKKKSIDFKIIKEALKV